MCLTHFTSMFPK